MMNEDSWDNELNNLNMKELILIKSGERYKFRYQSGMEENVLKEIVRYAQDPKCDFNWFDAAVLWHQIGRI